jgi:protein-tyrosine-phosphatase
VTSAAVNARRTVVIGFADALSAPEVLWSLTNAGFRVVAFARKGTRPALLQSRMVQVDYIADPAHALDESLADLQHLVQRETTPVLMPLCDESLWLMQEVAKRVSVRIAGAAGPQAEVALDKRLQLAAAKTSGFLVPETLNAESVAGLKAVSSFPVIAKPALAARVMGHALGRGRAHLIADAAELGAFAAQWESSEPMLIQPIIRGVGEGVFGIALENGVVCWSGHRRVRMMNPSGSGSSACVSMMPSVEIRAAAERFLKTIQWRGMFMIELLRGEDGRLWFMELNGRSWGSMALARRLGFEYPAWNVQLLLDQKFIPPAPAEKAPLVCRHLGRELLHLAFVWRGPKSKDSRGWPRRTEALRQVCRIRAGERWYNYNKEDAKVFWSETWQTLVSGLRSKKTGQDRASITTRIWNRLKRPIVRYNQTRIRANGRVIDLLKQSRHVLFLCYGNINRSALAEQHLRQLLGSDAQISSCGFHLPERRPLDPMMNSLARDAGIDFPSWSSRRINTELVRTADLIFAMETSHLVRLLREYPEAQGRAFLLSSVTNPNTIPLEIRDPFGGSPDVYKRCIREVTYATKVMSEIMKGSH